MKNVFVVVYATMLDDILSLHARAFDTIESAKKFCAFKNIDEMQIKECAVYSIKG